MLPGSAADGEHPGTSAAAEGLEGLVFLDINAAMAAWKSCSWKTQIPMAASWWTQTQLEAANSTPIRTFCIQYVTVCFNNLYFYFCTYLYF